MKPSMLKTIALIVAVCFAAGCFMKPFIKPKQEDIDKYVQAHPDLPDLDKQCIYDGRFEIGMKVETLDFLLGKPDRLDIVKQPWATQENWIYFKNGKKTFIIEEKHVVGILETAKKK
ncbi:MAG TPA: hypothetical protein VLX68_15280 [Chitinivibrionales bacterium]|nr:hypothetical protein [Chitinivibrionales bacterium]